MIMQKRIRTAYKRFVSSPITGEEMWRYMGVLLLLGINSIRSYRQAWNLRSSQVRSVYIIHTIKISNIINLIHLLFTRCSFGSRNLILATALRPSAPTFMWLLQGKRLSMRITLCAGATSSQPHETKVLRTLRATT